MEVDVWFESRDQALASFMLEVLSTLGANVLFPLRDALTNLALASACFWAIACSS
jgi:hypothetical protein